MASDVEPQLVSGSKLIKHQIVADEASLRPHLPDTRFYEEDALEEFLKRYETVFLKPEFGAGGRRVFRVKRRKRGGYRVSMEHEERVLYSLQDVKEWVREVSHGDAYLLQQAIELAHWHERPVDLRTLVQRDASGQWEVTGMFSKVAPKQLAVTNVCIGGSAHTVDAYFRALGYDSEAAARVKRDLVALSLEVVRPFHKQFDNAIYGLDLGLDTQGHLWLIEVNTAPSISILRRMRLRRMYNRSKELWMHNRAINQQASMKARPKPAEKEEGAP